MFWGTLLLVLGYYFSIVLCGAIDSTTVTLDTDSDSDSDNYIVVFKDSVSSSIEKRSLHISWIERLVSTSKNAVHGYLKFGKDITGYHGNFNKHQISQVRANRDVAFVEKDSHDTIQGLVYVQSNTPWGLSRISHKDNQGDNQYNYLFKNQGGKNSTIYVLDTGVMTGHREFNGRIRWGANFANDVNEDENGHGTHVAGIAAGYSVGVAKFANVVAVKILDARQRGTLSNFVKAMSWIIDDHNANPVQKSIINYSAVGEISKARDMAITKAIESGIFFVGAAGNKAADACAFGPPNGSNSSDGQVIVAALNYTDTPATFTNYGGCVDVYAPGVDIRSSINRGTSSYGTMSGTSMASPHVAGLIAYYWSLNPDFSHSDIHHLVADSNNEHIKNNWPDTVNKIAYNNI